MVQLRKDKKKGDAFTVVELIIVIVLIGIMSVIMILGFGKIFAEVRDSRRDVNLTSIANALEKFYNKNGEYPGCSVMSTPDTIQLSNMLGGLDRGVFSMPKNAASNSIICGDISDGLGDVITYNGNSAASCQTGQSCSYFIIKYREETTGDIIVKKSRHGFPPVPVPPVIDVSFSGTSVTASITSSSNCSRGTIQYAIRNRINDGIWGGYSAWSVVSMLSLSATDDVKYGFQAQSRCYIDKDVQSQIVTGVEYSDARISTPSAPASITTNTNGDNTTWSWSTVACVVGSVNYQLQYSISPIGYDSGWIDNGANRSATFLTNTKGQTYSVRVKARCSGVYAMSDWTSEVGATYYRPNVPEVSVCGADSVTSSSAKLCANVTSPGDSSVVDSGICWGVSSNPTENCTSNSAYGSVLVALNPATITTQSAPGAMTMSADGLSVYVVNYSSNSVSMFSRNVSTGLLTAMSPASIATGTNPYSIAVSADGKSVYVVNSNSNSVSMYSRNISNGVLTSLGLITATSALSVAISPDNTSVYVASGSTNSVLIYNRNVNSGILTAAGSVSAGTYPIYVMVSKDNKFVYASNLSSNNISMYNRNQSTGSLTTMTPSTISTGKSPYYIAISGNGKSAYVSNAGENTISEYVRNTSTGSLSMASIPKITTEYSPYTISISPNDDSVYVTNVNQKTSPYLGNISMYDRDDSTGLLTAMSPATIASGVSPFAITISPDGNYAYVTNNISGVGVVSMYRRQNNAVLVGSPFYQTRNGLSSGTKIYYRGYAVNSYGTGYSGDGNFTTL